MREGIVAVVVVRMTGSPGQVFESMGEALEEVRQLAQAMIDDEAMPAPIQVRTGTMSRQALDELAKREFPGY